MTSRRRTKGHALGDLRSAAGVSRARRSLLAVAALLAVSGLQGCGSTAPADNAVPRGGVDATVGRMHVDDALVDAPRGVHAGASAPLHVAFGNDSTRPDALIAVSTPVTDHVLLQRDGRPVRRLRVPPGRLTDLEHSARVVLADVRRTLQPGEWFPVTFEFARAGDVTVSVTVGPLGGRTAARTGPDRTTHPNPNPDHGGLS
jgi:copper(I)-binding protein